MTTQTPPAASWRELLRGPNGRIAFILSGGVALYAITTYITGAVLPAMTEQLNGDRLYAWVNTAFLAASIIGSASASTLTARLGLRISYLLGFIMFAAGSVLVSAAPAMEIVVAGRAIEGAGGGLLSALAYVAVSATLPEALWGRATGLVTVMWAVGGVFGPAVGGVFGSADVWRLPFAGLAFCALAIAVLAQRSLKATAGGANSDGAARRAIAIPSLLIVLVAVSGLSAAVLYGGVARLCWFAGSVLLLVVFLVVDARSMTSLLPRATYARQSGLRWVYLLVAVLAGSVMVEAFIPLFGQRLGGLSPLAAGYLAAVPSVGWTIAQFFSSSVTSDRARNMLRTVGPLITLAGLLVLAGAGYMSGAWVLWWLPSLAAIGAGVGMAFPHLAVAAMSTGRDDGESAQASAGISVVQLLSNTVFTSFCGLLLSTRIVGVTEAQIMGAGLALVVAVGVSVALVGLRRTK
ncbi:MAG: MFS transporter [Leifsonia sp.]